MFPFYEEQNLFNPALNTMIEVKDCKTVWSNCLSFIRQNVNEQSFKTWFEPIVPVKLAENVLTIQVPSQFFYEWLEEHYVNVLRKAIDMELGGEGRLEYSILVDQEGSTRPYNLNKSFIANGNRQPAAPEQQVIIRSPFDTEFSREGMNSQLLPKYSFDNFIEGDCNRLARAAGLAIANKPGLTSFNPLTIYGPVGLGKTHLIQAIGNQIHKQFADKSVLYVRSEQFANKFYQAIENNRIQEFTNFFMQLDVLILDDVQFFSGKEKTQDCFFHIFNHLHQNGKQIIMTSDRPAKDLKGFQERLQSRLKWGLTADLSMPDFETRIAIIRRKLRDEEVTISDNVIEYLAASADTSIRDLEGAMVTLIAQASLNQKEIDLDLAKSTLQNIVQNVEAEINIDFIQKFVGENFGVTIEQMKDKTRKREIVIARQVAMYFAKEYTNMSLKSIGAHFGGRDHSTVIHALQSVSDLMDTDKKFNAFMQELIKKVKLKAM